MMEWLPIAFALIVTGAVAGILAGLLGVGGGIVIVPVLYFIFQSIGISAATSMSVATGTSLLTIIATSISSIKAHGKRGNIEVPIVKNWVLYIVIGVLVGAFFATEYGGVIASLIFGVIAILIAGNMLFRAKAAALFQSLPNRLIQGVLGIFVGSVSSVMGIGGGTLGVPILTAFNIETHKAVGTAAVFGLIIAIPGALAMFFFASTPTDAPIATFGFVNLLGFAVIVPLTVMLAPVGVRIGSNIDSVLLKRIFALFLCLSGLRMIYQSIGVFTS